jgi:hypothetical protein
MVIKVRATAALLLTGIFVITSCSGTGSSGSSSRVSSNAATTPSSSGASQSSAPEPTMFKSATYGYTVTLPSGWSSRQAFAKWDGQSELDATSALVDLFGQPSVSRGIFAAAARWKRDLAAYTTFLISWNVTYHGDTCPPKPSSRNAITVGGQPGVLLAYNCGILINNVATVHDGVGYFFVFVDRGVAAATDPTDHATFLKVLRSVQFTD